MTTMGANLASKLGTGLKPKQFIESMEKNKEQFLAYYDGFAWDNEEDKEYFESLKQSR
jgi:hypothetical protein